VGNTSWSTTNIHGNPMLHAACHLFELELDNLGKYLLMSNTFTLAGRWGDVSRVRKAIMKIFRV
jgi:hypothetical protein